MAEHDVEAIWHDFWVPVLDGAVEGVPLGPSIAIPGAYFDQIKKELYDYHKLIAGLPLLYDDITGGLATKPNTDMRVIAQLVEERTQELIKEAIAEEVDLAQIEADAEEWQRGYDEGWADGHERGIDEGLDRARNSIW